MSRLAEIRSSKGMTQAVLADHMNTSSVSISRYEKEDQRLTLPLLRKLAKILDTTVADIAGEEIALPEEEFTLVSVYDAKASAGPGLVVFEDEKAIHQVAFRHEWLRRVTNAPIEMLAVIEADGESMAETIHHGDTLLVDRTQRDPRREGIYVINWDGLLNVKRITVNVASKTLTISSDNPAHPSEADVPPEDVSVEGRVVWIGRRV